MKTRWLLLLTAFASLAVLIPTTTASATTTGVRVPTVTVASTVPSVQTAVKPDALRMLCIATLGSPGKQRGPNTTSQYVQGKQYVTCSPEPQWVKTCGEVQHLTSSGWVADPDSWRCAISVVGVPYPGGAMTQFWHRCVVNPTQVWEYRTIAWDQWEDDVTGIWTYFRPVQPDPEPYPYYVSPVLAFAC